MEMFPIIEKLMDCGIAKVIADFDGQGDSGDIIEIAFYNINDELVDFDANDELTDYLYSLVHDCVNDYGGDWVNNDGGYGNITVNIKDQTINAHYYQRTVDDYTWSSSIFGD